MHKIYETPEGFEAFFSAYVTTALALSHDSEGETLDRYHDRGDIASDSLNKMRNDCLAFFTKHHGDFEGREYDAGHDFWLSRNGHGAGFWDGDWPEPAASELSWTCTLMRGCWLYIGDDGSIYLA